MTKALSIRQPWTTCILELGKAIENRSWSTPYRGPVLLHAAKSMTRAEYNEADDLCASLGLFLKPMDEFEHFGGIVGRADLIDCVTESKSPWFFGKYGFVLENVEPLPFMPCKGQLGFFDVEYREPVAA